MMEVTNNYVIPARLFRLMFTTVPGMLPPTTEDSIVAGVGKINRSLTCGILTMLYTPVRWAYAAYPT